METPQNDIPEESIAAEVVEGPPPETRAASYVQAPKLMRIASMTRAMLDEVRQAPLDDPGRRRLADVYDRSLSEMQDVLSDDLRQELTDIFTPISSEAVSESELRIAQAQLVGWLEGLFAGIQASLEERRLEHGILRTLGAGRRALLTSLAVEFTASGILAGILASLFAEVTGWLLAEHLFGLEFSFNPRLWVVGVLGSGLFIGLAGTLATYPLLIRPPLKTLRAAA